MRRSFPWLGPARRALAEEAGGLRDALDELAARLRGQLGGAAGEAAAGLARRAVGALLGCPPDRGYHRPGPYPGAAGRWGEQAAWPADWPDDAGPYRLDARRRVPPEDEYDQLPSEAGPRGLVLALAAQAALGL